MKPRILSVLVVALAASGLWFAAPAALAKKKKKFKSAMTFHVSIDPDPLRPSLPTYGVSAKEGVLDGIPGIVISQFGNLIDDGMGAPDFCFVLPKMDYASQTYPLDVPVRGIELDLCTNKNSDPEVHGIWIQGAATGFSVHLTSYDPKARGVIGTFSFVGVPIGPYGYGSQSPVDITGKLAFVIPTFDSDASRISFTSSKVPTFEFRNSEPAKTKYPLLRRYSDGTLFMEVWELQPTGGRIGAPHFTFTIPVLDFASQTYPMDVPATYVRIELRFIGCSGALTGGAGTWTPFAGAAPVVSLTGYDAKTKQLSGTFTFGPMPGVNVFDESSPATTVSGSFTLVVPKAKKKK